MEAVKRVDVLAGHLWFGVHRATYRPVVYLTCLRRPLETAVSGVLYTKAKVVAKLTDIDAALFGRQMLLLPGKPPTNFIKRLTGIEPDNRNLSAMSVASEQAISNLRKYFAVVGIVEKYNLFVDLLQRLLDPQLLMGKDFWNFQKEKRENPSVKSTSSMISLMRDLDSPQYFHKNHSQMNYSPRRVAHTSRFVDHYNASLRHDWRIYTAGYSICETQAEAFGLVF
jgi:hypothetical protein